MRREELHSKTGLFERGEDITYKGDANVAKFLLGGLCSSEPFPWRHTSHLTIDSFESA